MPNSSAIYGEELNEYDLREYEELSPIAQTMFDRTRAGYDPASDAVQYYTPTVCQDFMLVCDAYTADELPEEFTYGIELRPE